ncbi:hypothetical protein NIES4071_105220 (plasmid) [Calothrix sp. NIES-4071]|nr:hypothetical protein NIES4071_105220 [Calothrix sp. NIES-4071]BAZ64940.1 hypothetical protein NIES4105_106730 [Calothrix sp. NIES-4105]
MRTKTAAILALIAILGTAALCQVPIRINLGNNIVVELNPPPNCKIEPFLPDKQEVLIAQLGE